MQKERKPWQTDKYVKAKIGRKKSTRWRNEELRRKKKFFDFSEVQFNHKTNKSFIYPIFDYRSNKKYDEFLKRMIKFFKSLGINKDDFETLWSSLTGTPKTKVKEYTRGEEPIELWEFVEIIYAVGGRIVIEYDSKDGKIPQRYSAELQNSSRGEKLIIKSNGYIKFIIKFDTSNYDNWEIIIFKDTLVKQSLSKYLNEIIEGIKWYFDDPKKTPINMQIFKLQFKERWLKGEILKDRTKTTTF